MKLITTIPELKFRGYVFTNLLLYKTLYAHPPKPEQTLLTLYKRARTRDGHDYPVILITTNLVVYGHVAPPDTFYVKNYSENEGLQEALIDLGIIEIVEGSEPAYFGYNNSVRADLCQLTEQYR